ncbi:MAG: FAD-dependent oxidoreductase [Scytonema sp. PMC 1069.18]|nr:FAD-dependent oxidoreductase [Scytonema sp. PMC 1069.18]MEC4883368.1 FAD-dependent oxidoreductase [Scytonema sp. PMC 1070.18]
MRETQDFSLPPQTQAVEIAIVGAGISGLSAAWELHKLGIESLVVLEANSRVGGRTLNHSLVSGGYVERGGTWASPTQTALLALAEEMGVSTKRGKFEGNTIYGFRQQWTMLEADPTSQSEIAQQDFAQAMAKFEALCLTVPVEAPWEAPDAIALDSTTMAAWIEQNTKTDEARAWFEGCVRQILSGAPEKVSLLWMLHFVHTAGFHDLLETAEDLSFVGGTQQISLNIAERLGDRVWLNAPVTEISGYDGSLVQLVSGRGIIYAQQVIIAIMPKTVARIKFNPLLPENHCQLIAGWETMSWVKFHAIYEKPLWQGQITSGHFLCIDRKIEAIDISPENGSKGVIVGLLAPEYGQLSDSERKKICLEFLRETFGEATAQPVEFVEFDWNSEVLTGGCISALPPGLLTTAGPVLNSPVDRIHWAGTERSSVWVNYIEGAIRAGQKAARDVVSKLC